MASVSVGLLLATWLVHHHSASAEVDGGGRVVELSVGHPTRWVNLDSPSRVLMPPATADPPKTPAMPIPSIVPRAGSADRSRRSADAPDWQTYRVKRGDSLSALFERAGFTTGELSGVLALDDAGEALQTLQPGRKIQFRATDQGAFAGLRYAKGPLETLVVSTDGSGLDTHIERKEPRRVPQVVSGTVDISLAAAMQAAGVSNKVISEFTRIFRGKLDFRRDMRSGARFVVVYDERYLNGRAMDDGPIRAAELDNNGRTLRAFRFVDEQHRGHYYNADGQSLTPSLLRTPVNYTRVSSPFSKNRFHPLLHIWRPHYGVDLAAPKGTPVKAAGNGVVTFVGRTPGYGRLVKIRHSAVYTTRYGHMTRFAKAIQADDRVRQGEVIGYVGESGEATGPHLHFEIRVDGKPRDPLQVALPGAAPIAPERLADFQRSIKPLAAVLEQPDQPSTLLALRQRFQSATAAAEESQRLRY